jgi:RecG-like helicase
MQTNGTIEYAASRTRTAKFKGDYRWHERNHHWQQWVISQNGRQLTIELNERNLIPIKQIKIGGRVDVVGRVESVNGEFRMTNPDYTYTKKKLLSGKHIQHTNKSKRVSKSLFSPLKPKLAPIVEPRKSAKPSVRSKPVKPKTEFEVAMNNSLEVSKANSYLHLAERCSACGALVANGAAHDCH